MSSGRSAARLYAGYAGGFLALTLLSGIWLRAALLEPQLLGGFSFSNLLHAHSHVAFFGWTTMALFALLTRTTSPGCSARLAAHAHLVGLASAAAFVGFLFSGYAAHTIAISVLHVVLWCVFAAAVWRLLGDAPTLERRFYRASLAFLLLAGAGAMTPAVVMVRGITDPWLAQLSVQLFLSPFISGWLMLGVIGAVYARVGGGRWAGAVLWLVALGTLPATLLHTRAAPPAEWLTLLGRGGMLLLGAGMVLFAGDLLRRRVVPLLRVAGAAVLLKGLAEIAVGAGWLLELAALRPLAIVFLHLVLLGVVTPVLLATALPLPAAPRRAAAYAAGVALMLAALTGLGWPGAAAALASAGIPVLLLLQLALLGGALAAAATILLLVPLPVRRAAAPVGPAGDRPRLPTAVRGEQALTSSDGVAL